MRHRFVRVMPGHLLNPIWARRKATVKLRYTGGDQAHPVSFKAHAEIAFRKLGQDINRVAAPFRPDAHEQDRWASFPEQMRRKRRRYRFLEL